MAERINPAAWHIGSVSACGDLVKNPEIFNKVILKDPMKAKQLEKGLQQLSEEGTVQLFTANDRGENPGC